MNELLENATLSTSNAWMNGDAIMARVQYVGRNIQLDEFGLILDFVCLILFVILVVVTCCICIESALRRLIEYLSPTFVVTKVKDDWVCHICLDSLKESTVLHPCKFHAFHKGCIEAWHMRSHSCPICRGFGM